MGIRDAIFARGSTYAGLTALIGSGTSCRLYPSLAPPKCARPYVVYTLVDQTRDPLSGADSGLLRRRVQWNCYAAPGDASDALTGPDGASAVADQVEAAFNRCSGTFASVVIQDAYVENRLDDQWDDDVKLDASVVDALVWYEGS